MSRCFPFPPPGYELEGRSDDVALITEEKQKHEKHKDKEEKKKEKKERKEKKKERKERKEKERGEEKYKDKKDKKRKREKHRDKKDKNKDEEKSVGSLENQNDQSLVPERTCVELGNRVKNDGAMGSQMVQKITILEKSKASFLGGVQANGNGRLVVNDPRDHRGMPNVQSLQVDSRSLGNGRNSFGENQIKAEEGKGRNGYGYMVGAGGGDASKNADQNQNTKAGCHKGKEKKMELTGLRKDEVKQEKSNGAFLDFHSNIPSDLVKENNNWQRKLPKLKELNGFLHGENKNSGVRPNDMPRHTIVSSQVGGGVHPCKNSINIGVVGKRDVTDEKVNGKHSFPHSVIDNVKNTGPCQIAADNTKTENGRVHIVRIQRKMEPRQTSNSVAMEKHIANSSFDRKVPPSHPLVENGGEMAVKTPDTDESRRRVEEGKERNGHGYMIGTGGGDPSKNAFQNKNTKAGDKTGKKEKKRELTGSRKNEIKQETSNGNSVDFQSNIPSDLLKENNDCHGKLPKQELNGFLHAKDSGDRPNNMSRLTIVSPQGGQTGNCVRPCQNTINIGVVEKSNVITDEKVNGKLSSPQSVIDDVRNTGSCQNGRVQINTRVVSNGVISPHNVRIQRKMEPSQTSNGIAMAKQMASSSFDRKVPPSHPLGQNGGKMTVQTPDTNESRKHSSSRKENVAKTPTKAPHPDMQYLSLILTVPEVEWPETDDQEWLFDRHDSETKRPRLASPDMKHVWSEAVHLKCADVTALPYVIPY
ncbi:putative uncharacterized protein DDB_G0290989 [Salvia splendens]|uniref:putative uncharacterized protein DDB_G0290989 n=1 Tax=Salvia splendens TaxID=180675 RepID=UPI001C2542D9|nr:putative uncharacterized protein DDB_G0290989 [Salvia splendens]XP_041990681.1 putative uncharacterized protein DDB_G0290989 [Salvia splendens]